MVILSSTNDTKTSEHYIFNNIHFANWSKACDFFKFFILPYSKEQLGDFINDGIIDIGIYLNGGQNFRSAGSTKFRQDRPLRILNNHNENDSLITCIPSPSTLIDLKPK